MMAEFSNEKEILAATKSAYDHGFRKMDAFAPFPVEGLAEALGRKNTAVPHIVLGGGITGGTTGIVRAGSAFVRRAQTGLVRYYAATMLICISGVALYFLISSS